MSNTLNKEFSKRDEHLGIVTEKLNQHSDELADLRSELKAVRNELESVRVKATSGKSGARSTDTVIIVDGIREG